MGRFSLKRDFGGRVRGDILLWPMLLLFVALVLGGAIFCAVFRYPQKVHGIGILLLQGDLKQVLSPKAGTVEVWLLEEGDLVHRGEAMARLRDHHNHVIPIFAKVDGVLGEIIAYPDTQVGFGQAIAIVTNRGDPRQDLEVVGFVSSLEGKKLDPGMKALVDPSISDPYIHGHMRATVKRVGKLPMTKEAVQSIIKIPEIAKYIRKKIEAEPFVVVLRLERNEAQKTGYAWTGPGPNFALDSGVIVDVDVIYREPTLLELLWPAVFHAHVQVK
ncbi:MAG TPA: hypothetical protein VEL47_04595 [Myxococcota bacterium]|nr:hypothetical protein [Myxococcota bacterium]